MPARTTVIAATNPKGGTYCRAKSMQENLKMSSALFSRFDLVFAMVDDADEQADKRLSEHVMSAHTGARTTAAPLLHLQRDALPCRS